MKKVLSLLMVIFLMAIVVNGAIFASEDVGVNIGLDEISKEKMQTENYKHWVDEFKLKSENRFFPKTGEAKTLNIIGSLQETDFWCGPASAQIVIRYLTGITYSQSTLASAAGTNSSQGTFVYKLTNLLNDYIDKGQYNYIGTWETAFGSGLSYSIQNGYPVIAHTIANTYLVEYGNVTSDIGHYVTCYGYSMGWQGSTNVEKVSYFDTFDGFPGTYGEHTIEISDMEKAINENAGYYIAAY